MDWLDLLYDIRIYHYKNYDWINVQGKIKIEKNKLYGRPGPVIYADISAYTDKPEKEVATFY